MEVILREDIIGLGFKNDIVTVKGGYGRNFLIPQGKAVIASKSAVKMLEENLRQQQHKLAALKAKAEEQAKVLEGVKVEIAARVSAIGVCYGSVTSAMVSAELAKKNIEIDRKLIIMKDIKKLGEYVATVVFHKEVQVELPVVVVAENAAELQAEKERQEQIYKEAAAATAPKAEETEEATEEAPAEEAKAE